MSYQRVLLLNPPYSGIRVEAVLSAGLGYIAESLKAAHIAYDFLDMSLGYAFCDLKNKIKEFRPDLIAVSMMTYRYQETYRLVFGLKKDFPLISIVVGGPHMSLFRDEVLRDCSAIDYGIVLEGEETIVELCQGQPVNSLKGLVRRQDSAIVYNGDRPFIEDLNKIPFPTYEAFELDRCIDKQVNALPIVSSRGCPFDCVYCPVKCSIGEAFRARSPESVVEELAYWRSRGYKRFSFSDDNFTLMQERVYALCDALQRQKLNDLKLSCDNGIRADRVDRDLLKRMKDAGFYRIAFGVEGGNDKVLKNLKKRESIDTIKQRIREACGLGYEVDLFFLVGSPGETRQDLEDSFKIASAFPIGTAYFYNIIPFPHTELFSWIKSEGKLLEEPGVYLNDYPILDNRPLFETPTMSRAERKVALRDAFAIMRQTMQKAWTQRLSHLGVFGAVLAFFYTRRFVQDVVLRNKFLRRLVYGLAHAWVKF